MSFSGNLTGFFFAMIFRPSASIKTTLSVTERAEIKDLNNKIDKLFEDELQDVKIIKDDMIVLTEKIS